MKHVNEHHSTCTVVNSDLSAPIHTQSHQLSFQECWSIHIIHKLPDTMSAANLNGHINLYFNPDSLLLSTSCNLTRSPPPLLPLPFSALVAPANTLVSLLLQLMKAIVHRVLYATKMSTDVSQIDVTLFSSF